MKRETSMEIVIDIKEANRVGSKKETVYRDTNLRVFIQLRNSSKHAIHSISFSVLICYLKPCFLCLQRLLFLFFPFLFSIFLSQSKIMMKRSPRLQQKLNQCFNSIFFFDFLLFSFFFLFPSLSLPIKKKISKTTTRIKPILLTLSLSIPISLGLFHFYI